MQDKQKVTLYLSTGLHRQLKIQAAIDAEPMSSFVERALVFYLANPDLVDGVESLRGHTHQVHTCPGCETSLVLRDGEMLPLSSQLGVLTGVEESLLTKQVRGASPDLDSQGEAELVPC